MICNDADYFGKHHAYLLPQDNFYTRKISNTLKDKLDLKPGDSILEFGCGAGRFSIPLLDAGLDMTCVDFSAELIEVFKKHLKPHHRAALVSDDLFKMEGQFDYVTGFFVLHHFKDHAPLFKKISQLLKPGGRMGFIEPNPYNPLYYIAPLFYPGITFSGEYYWMCDRDRISKVLKETGFKDILVEKFGFLPPQVLNLGFGPSLDRVTGWGMPKLCHWITARKP